MFKLTANHAFMLMEISLPEGKTQEELVSLTSITIADIERHLHGVHLQINGRITTAMALYLGHRLAHICKTVSIYDPKEKSYVLCINH